MKKIAEVFQINRRIQSEFQTAAALLRDAEVIRALRFLNDLDELAEKFQFTPRDILMYLAPRKESSQPSDADQGVIQKLAAKAGCYEIYTPSTGISCQTLQESSYRRCDRDPGRKPHCAQKVEIHLRRRRG